MPESGGPRKRDDTTIVLGSLSALITYQATACYGVDSPLIHPGSVATAANCEVNGISDLSGNVAEWTGSFEEGAPLERVIRGGSFRSRDWEARCTSRTICDAHEASPEIGFRVAVVPLGSASLS